MRGQHQRDSIGPIGVGWRLVAALLLFTLSCVLAILLFAGVMLFGLWLYQR